MNEVSKMCGCIGPQNGEPLCPCRMTNVRQVDGRWVETIDHGPVRPPLASTPAGLAAIELYRAARDRGQNDFGRRDPAEWR